ncbi:hypothetical protein SAMN05428957_105129 [Oryzisolibacter propanilivorax]|uniref:Uncharacterized protein n=1 Tax=Oryzisolibacter propanilivorax TaxID=1527607 RepID=A0A1G9ST20_9BURK|nr:hypothetical protein [Oryzisolibacter propanilivorax]SDM38598.1 hypothetical protein SAMN05428957_105129 [Oryzisolibacter propanilivorax]
MKPFALTPEMTSASGTFYPTGYVFALFPSEGAVHNAAQQLEQQGHDDVSLAAPDAVMQHVVRTLGNADDPLPSVGAEGVIVRRIAELASGGAHALMFEARDDDTPEDLRAALQQAGATAAFYYRRLIIEDLISTQ